MAPPERDPLEIVSGSTWTSRLRPVVLPVTATLAAVALAFAGGWYLGERASSPGSETDPGVPAAARVAASPTPTPAPKGRLVIHGTGDVNLDPSYIGAFRSKGYGWAWSGLDGLFSTDSLTVINLECAPGPGGAEVSKLFNFRCDPAAYAPAREAGVEVANLANNHGLDYGPDAMLAGRPLLTDAGITPVGAGANLDEAVEPALFEIAGWRVAVLGFGGVVPALDWLATPERPGMSSGDDIPQMVQAVRAADEVADLVFVTIHWGAELETEPQAEDVDRAHAMIDAGADAIFGHHSHRLQPLGRYRDRPIFWGLGNFVWPDLSAAGSRTAVARVVVEPDGRVDGCLIPADIVSDGHPVVGGDAPCG